MGEFDFIARYFRPLSGAGSFSLRNDGAVLCPPSGDEVVISSDTMVENVHFLPDDPPFTIGQKLMRCNLSDLAAMGARPHKYTLNVSVPHSGHYDSLWFEEFSRGLQSDQEHYGLSLLGGDTTSIDGPLVLSMTIYGFAAKGCTLPRDGARPGQGVWVTGSLGKAALGLAVRRHQLVDPDGDLVSAYRCPTPRIGLNLYNIISACMDISDGLLQDAGHIAAESSLYRPVSLILEEKSLPFDPTVLAAGPKWREIRLLGGDDYELLMTCAAENEERLKQEARTKNIKVTKIGWVTEAKAQKAMILDENGQAIPFSRTGWQHFE